MGFAKYFFDCSFCEAHLQTTELFGMNFLVITSQFSTALFLLMKIEFLAVQQLTEMWLRYQISSTEWLTSAWRNVVK